MADDAQQAEDEQQVAAAPEDATELATPSAPTPITDPPPPERAEQVAVLYDGAAPAVDAGGVSWARGYYQFVDPAVRDALIAQPGFSELTHLRPAAGGAGLPRARGGQNP